MGIYDVDDLFPQLVQETFRLYNQHVALIQPFDQYVPKHHAFYHLLRNSAWQGNPTLYANWEDEALNKVLKGCCRNISQLRFEDNVLLRMRELLRSGHKRQHVQ